jgi:DNA sulfur modification protein DndC
MGLDSATAILADQSSASAFEAIRAELLHEYRQDHTYPWIIGYSGGKDSLDSNFKCNG